MESDIKVNGLFCRLDVLYAQAHNTHSTSTFRIHSFILLGVCSRLRWNRHPSFSVPSSKSTFFHLEFCFSVSLRCLDVCKCCCLCIYALALEHCKKVELSAKKRNNKRYKRSMWQQQQQHWHSSWKKACTLTKRQRETEIESERVSTDMETRHLRNCNLEHTSNSHWLNK